MAIAYVRSARGENFGGGEDTSIVSASAYPNDAGNVSLAGFRFQDNDTTKAITSVADLEPNTYEHITTSFRATGSTELDWWGAINIGANASNVVTGTTSGGVAYRAVLPIEYSGFPTTGTLAALVHAAGRAEGEGTGSPLTIGPIDAPANSLVVAIASIDTTGVTWTAGTVGGNAMTIRQEDANNSVVVQDYVVGGSDLNGVNVTIGCSDTSTLKYMLVIVLKESAGGGGGSSANQAFLTLGVG